MTAKLPDNVIIHRNSERELSIASTRSRNYCIDSVSSENSLRGSKVCFSVRFSTMPCVLSCSFSFISAITSPKTAKKVAARMLRPTGTSPVISLWHRKRHSQTVHVWLYVANFNIFQKSSKYITLYNTSCKYEPQWSVRSMQELNHDTGSRQEFQSCYSQSINDECIKAHVHHNSANHYYTCAVAFPFAATKLVDRKADLEEASANHLW